MNQAIAIRAPFVLSTDMLLTGFAKLLDLDVLAIKNLISKINFSDFEFELNFNEVIQNGISGWKFALGCENKNQHQDFDGIKKIIAQTTLSDLTKQRAVAVFKYLAEAESAVHKAPFDKIKFHEIGRFSNIVTVCLTMTLFEKLNLSEIILGSVPICDGVIECAHGTLSTPAPATHSLLEGFLVRGISAEGESVTPTTLAVLKVLAVKCGKWPDFKIQKVERVYGKLSLQKMPNWAIVALGQLFPGYPDERCDDLVVDHKFSRETPSLGTGQDLA